MKNRFLILFLILVFIYVAAIFLIVGVNKARGAELNPTKVFDALLLNNKSLQERVKELEKENANLKALLKECYTALQQSNAVIEDLDIRVKTLAYLYGEQSKELEKAKKKWLIGGGISYPLGGELIGGRLWNDFGVYVGAGFIDRAYLKGGVVLRIK